MALLHSDGPRQEKTCLQYLRSSNAQTTLLSYRDQSIEILHEACLGREQITKVLIRLWGCIQQSQVLSHQGLHSAGRKRPIFHFSLQLAAIS